MPPISCAVLLPPLLPSASVHCLRSGEIGPVGGILRRARAKLLNAVLRTKVASRPNSRMCQVGVVGQRRGINRPAPNARYFTCLPSCLVGRRDAKSQLIQFAKRTAALDPSNFGPPKAAGPNGGGQLLGGWQPRPCHLFRAEIEANLLAIGAQWRWQAGQRLAVDHGAAGLEMLGHLRVHDLRCNRGFGVLRCFLEIRLVAKQSSSTNEKALITCPRGIVTQRLLGKLHCVEAGGAIQQWCRFWWNPHIPGTALANFEDFLEALGGEIGDLPALVRGARGSGPGESQQILLAPKFQLRRKTQEVTRPLGIPDLHDLILWWPCLAMVQSHVIRFSDPRSLKQVRPPSPCPGPPRPWGMQRPPGPVPLSWPSRRNKKPRDGCSRPKRLRGKARSRHSGDVPHEGSLFLFVVFVSVSEGSQNEHAEVYKA